MCQQKVQVKAVEAGGWTGGGALVVGVRGRLIGFLSVIWLLRVVAMMIMIGHDTRGKSARTEYGVQITTARDRPLNHGGYVFIELAGLVSSFGILEGSPRRNEELNLQYITHPGPIKVRGLWPSQAEVRLTDGRLPSQPI